MQCADGDGRSSVAVDLRQRLLLKWDMCEEGDEQYSIIFVSENPQRPTQKRFFKTNFGWNLNEKESGVDARIQYVNSDELFVREGIVQGSQYFADYNHWKS